MALLAATSCAQVPMTAAVTVPPVPAGEARVWFYRDEGPYETHAPAIVRINDAVVGELAPRGAFYRDTGPGHYHVAVDTYLADVNSTRDIELRSGQQIYFKIVSSSDWFGGGGQSADTDFSRAAFYVWLIPTAVAQRDVASSPFYGSR
jgi:Protein of unknown function (DUF2846)